MSHPMGSAPTKHKTILPRSQQPQINKKWLDTYWGGFLARTPRPKDSAWFISLVKVGVLPRVINIVYAERKCAPPLSSLLMQYRYQDPGLHDDTHCRFKSCFPINGDLMELPQIWKCTLAIKMKTNCQQNVEYGRKWLHLPLFSVRRSSYNKKLYSTWIFLLVYNERWIYWNDPCWMCERPCESSRALDFTGSHAHITYASCHIHTL